MLGHLLHATLTLTEYVIQLTIAITYQIQDRKDADSYGVGDDDNDGLTDIEDPDCRPPGEEFRFELSNCQIEPGNHKNDSIGCSFSSQGPLVYFH